MNQHRPFWPITIQDSGLLEWPTHLPQSYTNLNDLSAWNLLCALDFFFGHPSLFPSLHLTLTRIAIRRSHSPSHELILALDEKWNISIQENVSASQTAVNSVLEKCSPCSCNQNPSSLWSIVFPDTETPYRLLMQLPVHAVTKNCFWNHGSFYNGISGLYDNTKENHKYTRTINTLTCVCMMHSHIIFLIVDIQGGGGGGQNTYLVSIHLAPLSLLWFVLLKVNFQSSYVELWTFERLIQVFWIRDPTALKEEALTL